MARKIIAYRLEPVYEIEPGSICTAAVMSCMATGEMLEGMGGGGDFFSPKVVEMLRGGGCTITKDVTKASSDVVEAAIELLARLEEIGGNKAGAFTLRNHGAVGVIFEAKLKVMLAALRSSDPNSEGEK